ncbi:MAG: hypothetical protein ABIW38_11940 [Ferruginibacter sp.]
MKQYFVIIILLLWMPVACISQLRLATVPHSYAFFTVSVPGALQADENGNPINNFITSRFIYIETTGRQPLNIYSITSQGNKYKFTIEEESANPVIVGNNYTTNLPMKIKVAKTNCLWKVSYSPVSGKDIAASLKNIIVSGKADGKSFKLVLPKDIQLAGAMLY